MNRKRPRGEYIYVKSSTSFGIWQIIYAQKIILLFNFRRVERWFSKLNSARYFIDEMEKKFFQSNEGREEEKDRFNKNVKIQHRAKDDILNKQAWTVN